MENDNKYFGYIYKFTDDTTGKIYVGKREKPTFDKRYYGSGKKWVTEVLNNENVGKEHVIREVLEWCCSREELESREKFWIAELDARNPEVGYNIHKGGKGGNSLGDTEAWSKLHSGERNGRFGMEVLQETRDKISAANSGTVMLQETKDKISASTKGKPKPEGFGKKVSIATKGRNNIWQYKPVMCIETGIIYDSPCIAASATGICRQNISRSCRTKYAAGGYHWRYIDEDK